jgi:hypothetical protein
MTENQLAVLSVLIGISYLAMGILNELLSTWTGCGISNTSYSVNESYS